VRILASSLLCCSSLSALYLGASSANGSWIRDTVKHSRQIDASFRNAAAYVDAYIVSNGDLPSRTTFETWTRRHPSTAYEINDMRLESLSSSPSMFAGAAQPPKNGYILRYWRGEWEETYTSLTQKSSIEIEESSYYLFGSRLAEVTLALLVFAALLIASIKVWPRKRRAA
jgi:hypothetical protein